jgi:hypothetical protein
MLGAHSKREKAREYDKHSLHRLQLRSPSPKTPDIGRPSPSATALQTTPVPNEPSAAITLAFTPTVFFFFSHLIRCRTMYRTSLLQVRIKRSARPSFIRMHKPGARPRLVTMADLAKNRRVVGIEACM